MGMTHQIRRVSWALAAMVLLLCTTAHAQIITSTILGHVIDSSGAVVPGAQVAVTNQGTSLTNKTTTDSGGDYSVPSLAPGVYTVTVTMKGFEISQVTGVILRTTETQRVDATLKVGTSSQMVTVTGEKVSMVHTDSVSVGTLFTNQQLGELPLFNDTIDALDKLVPGYMFAQILSNSRVNGGLYVGSINYALNGGESNDQANGGMAYGHNLYATAYPTPESFQEYRVDTMNNNAEFARTTTITMVTRSGTNQIHGDMEELNANAALNANAFTNNANGGTGAFKRPGYVRNQFGINIGGPVKRDRIWLFGNYSMYDDRYYTPESLSMPSLSMAQGNFGVLCTSLGATFNASGVCSSNSGQLYNPLTGAAFAGNVIPASMFASQSSTLLNYLPPPNIKVTNAGGLDITGLPNGATDFITQNRNAHDQPVTNDRFDVKLTEKDLLYGTYTRAGSTAYQEADADPQTYGQDIYPITNIGYSLAENHTFSPTAVNEFRYNWFYKAVVEYGINLGFNPQTLFPGLENSYNRGLPAMSMTGYTGMFTDIGNLPVNKQTVIEFTDNFTKVHGHHTMKFGADEFGAKNYKRAVPGSLGSFTFNGQWTAGKGWSNAGVTPSGGNTFADFLLGDASADSLVPPSTYETLFAGRNWSGYAQDTWQATRQLTVYYGVRYELDNPWRPPIIDGVGIGTYYDIATNQIALLENSTTPYFPPVDASLAQFNAYNVPTACPPNPSCFTTTKALGLPINWAHDTTNNFDPRFGFAYRPFKNSNNTVIRAGYGVYHDQYNAAPDTPDGNTPWIGNASTGFTYTSALPASPPATGYQPDLPFSNPFPTTLGASAAPAAHPTLTFVAPNYKNAVIQQWNLTLEHEFRGHWLGQITYFGDQAHHITWFNGDIDIPQTMQAGAIQAQLPIQPWAAVDSYRSGGKSNFEELVVQMTKRLGDLTVQSYYTYAHSLDDASGDSTTTEPADPYDERADYGNTVDVRRQMFNIAYIYRLPFGRDKRFLPGSKGILNALVGGWEWSGDTTYGSGVPFTMLFAVPASQVGWIGQNTTPSMSNRANLITGVPIYNRDKSSHAVFPTGVPWINQAAFTAPAPFSWGDSSRGAYFGPGWENYDMALLKNFKLPWREGLALQFRIEGTNVWNHYNLGSPGTSLFGFGSIIELATPQYGGPAATPTQGLITGCAPNCPTNASPYAQGDRYFQIGAKLFF